MSMYSDKQRQFIDTFMAQANDLLTHRLNEIEDDSSLLDSLAQASDALSAGITLVSLVVAIPTLGASLGVGAACIVLLQTGTAVYRYVKSHTNSTDSLEDLAHLDRAEKQLSISVLLRQTAHLLAIRYAHTIDDIIVEQDVKEFSKLGFARAVKKLTLELQAQAAQNRPLSFPEPEVLCDYLLTSNNLSAIYDTKSVTLKKPAYLLRFYTQSKAYTKRLYAQARWITCNKTGECTMWASDNESLIKTDATIPEYGLITVSESCLKQKNLAINTKRLKPATYTSNQQLMVEHPVSRQEVKAYLAYIRANNSQESLNDYLTRQLNIRVIATCHNDVLKRLNLAQGNFSEVNFHHANLAGCNLKQTIWQEAHLEWAHFDGNDLTEVVFQKAHLERSSWLNVDFTGDFCDAHMNGAELIDCNFSLTLQKQGCDFELCTRTRVTENHEQVTFNRYIDERLSLELRERIELGKELSKQINTLSQEIQALQHTEKQRWDEQYAFDRLILERINQLESEQDVASVIWQRWENGFNTDQYQEAKKSYVELLILCTSDQGPISIPIGDKTEQFMQSDEKFLLIIGGNGAGKTFNANLIQENLLRTYQNPQTDWLPIYIRLGEVPFSEDNFLLNALKQIFSEPQLLALVKQRIVFIFDGLEDSKFSLIQRHLFEECNRFARLWQPHAFKVIAFTHKRFLLELEQDFLDVFRTEPTIKLDPGAVCDMLPLNAQQKARMLHSFHLDERKLKELGYIQPLFNTPLMFKMVALVIRYLTKDKPLPTSRLQFYDAYNTIWFERIKAKLPSNEASENQFQFHLQHVAFEMHKAQTDWLDRPYQHERQNRQKVVADPLSHLFDSQFNKISPLEMTLVKRSAGDIVRRYQFKDRSFVDYFLAQYFLNDFLDDDVELQICLQNWQYSPLTESTLHFLKELIQDHPEKPAILHHLLEMVLASRQQANTRYLRASANAMTLLCRLGYNFSGKNLSGIRIPEADLSGALLAFANLANGNLSGVCFHEANLFMCNMKDTILTNARFLNAPLFIQAELPIQTFAVYPYISTAIVAYVIPPDANHLKYRIAIARLSDGKIYQCWDAHSQKISALTWSTHKGIARLASAGEGGMIRIWEVINPNEPPKDIAALSSFKHKCPIEQLIWYADGNLLALCSADNVVRIWDVNKKSRIFKSDIHESAVHAIACSQLSTRLFSCSEQGKLRVFDNLMDTPIKELDLHTLLDGQQISAIHTIALSYDEEQLAFGCENGDIIKLGLKEVNPGIEILLGHTDKVTALIWAEHALLSASADTTIRVWINKEESHVFQHDNCVGKIELSADGHQLISGGGGRSTHICAWNLTKPHHNPLTSDKLGRVTALTSFKHPEKEFIAAGFINGTVHIWRVNTLMRPLENILIYTYSHANAAVSRLSWSPDGRYLASMGQDKTILIKDMSMLHRTIRICAKENTCFNDIQWLTSDLHFNHLGVGSSDGHIYIYNCQQGSDISKPYIDLAEHHAMAQNMSFRTLLASKPAPPVNCFAVAPTTAYDQSGSWLVSSQAQMISIWVLRRLPTDNTCLSEFIHPNGNAIHLAWSPNGCYFVSSDKDHSIYVWDADKYVCLLTHQQPLVLKSLIWHQNWLILATQKGMLLWQLPENPNWGQSIKTILIGASHLSSSDTNLVIAKEQGIYILNFAQLLTQPMTYNSWVGSIKTGLILDQCQLTDVVGLSTATLNYVLPKGVLVPSQAAPQGFFSQFFKSKSPPPPITESLPIASSTADLMKRFSIFSIHKTAATHDETLSLLHKIES